MAQVYLSVSSNYKRQRHISTALSMLTDLFSELEVSSVYRNPPLLGSGNDYYNLALGLKTQLSMAKLVATLKEIENSLGRERGQSIQLVSIDIDLLRFESSDVSFVCSDICNRSYLLKPLSDIASKRVDPKSALNYQQLWTAFDHSQHPLVKVDLTL